MIHLDQSVLLDILERLWKVKKCLKKIRDYNRENMRNGNNFYANKHVKFILLPQSRKKCVNCSVKYDTKDCLK